MTLRAVKLRVVTDGMAKRAAKPAKSAPRYDQFLPAGGSVLLFCPGVATVRLPWWPSEVSRSGLARNWDEIERPGRQPLLLSSGRQLGEYNLSFTLRYAEWGTSVRGILDGLADIAASEIPVSLVMAQTSRGLFQVTTFDPVEIDHDANGQPATVDVSLTLKRASDATVNVGPVKGMAPGLRGGGKGYAT